jgi:hypothetical protein
MTQLYQEIVRQFSKLLQKRGECLDYYKFSHCDYKVKILYAHDECYITIIVNYSKFTEDDSNITFIMGI